MDETGEYKNGVSIHVYKIIGNNTISLLNFNTNYLTANCLCKKYLEFLCYRRSFLPTWPSDRNVCFGARGRSPGRAQNAIFSISKIVVFFYGFYRRPFNVDGRVPTCIKRVSIGKQSLRHGFTVRVKNEIERKKNITSFRRNDRFEIEFYRLIFSNSNARRSLDESYYGRPRGLGSVRLRL